MAGAVLDDEVDSHKTILLITDGEDQESFPVEAAAAVWEEQQIPIIAIALGDPKRGARIPIQTAQGKRYLTYQGDEVWTKADFSALEQVVDVSDQGIFVPVGTSNFDLARIYGSVARAIRFEEDAEQQRYHQPSRYHPFAVLALLLVLLDSFLRDGPRRGASAQVRGARREAA
jgi:Ca-activated chloride channel family protein